MQPEWPGGPGWGCRHETPTVKVVKTQGHLPEGHAVRGPTPAQQSECHRRADRSGRGSLRREARWARRFPGGDTRGARAPRGGSRAGREAEGRGSVGQHFAVGSARGTGRAGDGRGSGWLEHLQQGGDTSCPWSSGPCPGVGAGGRRPGCIARPGRGTDWPGSRPRAGPRRHLEARVTAERGWK